MSCSSKKAFDLGKIPSKINLNEPPTTGFDYLYRVRIESKRCPKVVVATIDTSRFQNRQTVIVDAFNGFVRARPGFEPDIVWQEDQLESFRKLRCKFAEDKDLLKKKFKKVNFPTYTKAEEWCMFCLGQEVHSKIYPPSSDDAITAPKSKKLCYSFFNGNPPLLSILAHMNQRIVIRVLSYHLKWLEHVEFSKAQGQWLYALLVCLEKPLYPDTCALLRGLSRQCSKLRDQISSPEHELLQPLNLILCIIAQYFDQKDMSDEFDGNP